MAGDGGLRIAVTGASGLIGRRLVKVLAEGGHEVSPFVRREPAPGTSEIHWDPSAGVVDAAGLEGTDAVVHLAGETIGQLWTRQRREAILRSRGEGTALLSLALAGLSRRPAVLVAASAVGFYGDRGDEVVDEDSEPGSGFLADVCREWEAATEPAEQAGIRVVRLRIGMVLARDGGALAKVVPVFKWGLGGRIGSGRQYVSWISLTDLVRVIVRSLTDSGLSGPVNAVAPNAVTHATFARTLGRVLGRPAFVPTPRWAIRLAFGQMGRELLLTGARVRPARLEASGFTYLHADLAGAIGYELSLGG